MSNPRYVNWKHPAGAGWFQLSGSIDATKAGEMTAAVLNFLDKNQEKPATFVLYVNSVGGMVQDAIAMREMVSLMRRAGHKVVVIVLRCASAANMLATCGDEVYMGKNSYWMYHSLTSSAEGEPGTIEAEGAFSKRLYARTLELTASRKLPVKKARDMIAREKTVWLDAKQCYDLELIDGILREPPIRRRSK